MDVAARRCAAAHRRGRGCRGGRGMWNRRKFARRPWAVSGRGVWSGQAWLRSRVTAIGRGLDRCRRSARQVRSRRPGRRGRSPAARIGIGRSAPCIRIFLHRTRGPRAMTARRIAPEAAERVIAAVARIESLRGMTVLIDDLVPTPATDPPSVWAGGRSRGGRIGSSSSTAHHQKECGAGAVPSVSERHRSCRNVRRMSLVRDHPPRRTDTDETPSTCDTSAPGGTLRDPSSRGGSRSPSVSMTRSTPLASERKMAESR